MDETIFKAYDVRGIYPDQMDEDAGLPDRARRSPACSRISRTCRSASCASALGRDMRLSAPAMAEQYARGIADEGADVLDIGMVGTEMLYWTVGSRELDGGLMCTASHNPKAYTGAKLVKRGALALSGDSGIGELREIVSAGEPGPAGRRRPARSRRRTSAEAFREAALGYIDPSAIAPAEGRARRRQRHGRTDGRARCSTRSRSSRCKTYWEPDGEFPDHEPNPLLEENRRFIIDKVRETGADLGIAWDGDADRCFFIDDTGEFVAGDFLTALLAESILRKEPGATVLYDVRASRAVRDVVERAGGTATGQPGRPRLLQDAHARDGRRLRRRGVRALLLPRLLLRRLGHDARAADARAPVERGHAAERAARAAALALLHLRRDQLRGRGPGGEDGRARRALLGRRGRRAGRRVGRLRRTGTSTCGPRTPSRCCASTWSRWCRGSTWSEKRDEVLALIRA